MSKLAIATPVYGCPEIASGYFAYFNPLLEICRSVDVIPPRLLGNCDLVRARSRAVAIALEREYTHLLFWDSDVGGSGAPQVLQGMINERKDFIAAPYARKVPGDTKPTHQDNGYVGMGFTLLSRKCLEAMVWQYRPELLFNDVYEGKPHPTVALFMLMLYEQKDGSKTLLGEDYSFCERWKRMSGDIFLYDGPGLPLVHVGGYAYT